MSEKAERCKQWIGEAVTARVRTAREHIAAVRAEDPDGIHDLRVASRRLRAALAELKAFLPQEPRAALVERARTITQLLGRPRELDVSLALLRRGAIAVPDGSETAFTEAIAYLEEKRLAVTPDCLEAADLTESPDMDAEAAHLLGGIQVRPRDLRDAAALRLERRFHDLDAEYEAWTASGDPAQLHRVRVAFKKFRYACEVLAPCHGDGFHDLIGELKCVQEHLGDYNDGRVLALDLAALTEAEVGTEAAPATALVQAVAEWTAVHLAAFCPLAEAFFDKPHRKKLRKLFQDTRVPEA